MCCATLDAVTVRTKVGNLILGSCKRRGGEEDGRYMLSRFVTTEPLLRFRCHIAMLRWAAIEFHLSLHTYLCVCRRLSNPAYGRALPIWAELTCISGRTK